MKKGLGFMLAGALVCSTLFTACSNSGSSTPDKTNLEQTSAAKKEDKAPLKVVYLVNGNLGD